MEDGSGGGVPAPVFTGGRLFAGTMEGGMGPRIREDNEGKGNCRNGGMSGKREEGGRARMRDSSAALGMICGWGKRWGWVPAAVFTGAGSRRGNNGGRDGSPPPVFTGAGSRRGDNEGKGGGGGSGWHDMWVVGRDSRRRFHGWQALRGNNGERDGSPHARGQ